MQHVDKASPGGKNYKVLILGDKGVGKTLFLRRYFNENYSDEDGRDHFSKFISLSDYNFPRKQSNNNNNNNALRRSASDNSLEMQREGDLEKRFHEENGNVIKLSVWDFKIMSNNANSLPSSYYRGVDAYIILYDVTSSSSYENIKNWIANVKRFGPNDTSAYAIVVVGNKIDLILEKVVEFSEAQAKFEEENFKFMEISALKRTNVDEVFDYLIMSYLKKFEPQVTVVSEENHFKNRIKKGIKKLLHFRDHPH